MSIVFHREDFRVKTPWLRLVVSLVASGALSTATLAQGVASLRGSVSDESGAFIVGAAVTLTDANGSQKTVITNSDGTYLFSGLALGKYKVRAAAAGFAISEVLEVL